MAHLSREMPLEGGIYQWAKLRFGGLAGFLVAVNLWALAVLMLAANISAIPTIVTYALGPGGSWIAESRTLTIVTGTAVFAGLMWIARRGLGVAKWLHNIGGVVPMLFLVGMVLLALPRWMHGGAAVTPVAFTIPALSLLNINLLGQMSFGAFSGFDGVAIFSGEIQDPDVARSVRRSVVLAGPLIGLIYILGTACVLTFTRSSDLDLVAPATQAITRGAQGTALAFLATPLAAVLAVSSSVFGASVLFNTAIRLPMVAGWDHILPEKLSELHPRFRTPVISILCVGAAAIAVLVFGNADAGAQEAFQLLNSAGVVCWALTYLVMFAIPIAGAGEKAPGAVRIASVPGFLMTLLCAVLAVFPVINVPNPWLFSARMAGIVIVINAIGAVYYWRARKRLGPVITGR